MSTPFARPRARDALAIGAVLALFMCAAYECVVLRRALTYELKVAPIAELVQGVAATPFQYRALVPFALKFLVVTKAIGAKDAGACLMTSDTLAAFAFFAAVLVWARRNGESLARAATIALLGGPLLLSVYALPRFGPGYYPSDLPALAFFTAGLVALEARAWRYFYPIFLLGTFNRETTCFLTIVYVLDVVGRRRRASASEATAPAHATDSVRVAAIHVGAQAVAWIAIKAWLFHAYAGNPGSGLVELRHLAGNLASLATVGGAASVLTLWGGLGVFVMARAKDVKNPFVRHALGAPVLYFGAMMLVGNVAELRVFGELTGLVLFATVGLLGLGEAGGGARVAHPMHDTE